MASGRVRIDRLSVRVRGLHEADARNLAAGLGAAVMERLNPLVINAEGPRLTRVDVVEAGTLRLASRDQIADAVAQAVTSHLTAAGKS